MRKTTIILILLVCVLFLSSCTMTGQPVRKTYERANVDQVQVDHVQADLMQSGLRILDHIQEDDVSIRSTCEEIGDMNCDGEVSFGDINPFVKVMIHLHDQDWSYYYGIVPYCDVNNEDHMRADINRDGELDFGDINPFVKLMTKPECDDGVDNDCDGGIDFDGVPNNDAGCYSSNDTSENSTCGNNHVEADEICDGTDDSACPGECIDCTCPGTEDECSRCYELIDDECVPKTELCADFVVQKLVSVNPDVWEDIDLSEDIELGLKVRFDASGSTEVAWYSWTFSEGTWGDNNPILDKYLDESGWAKLKVFDSSGIRNKVITEYYTVDEGMSVAWTGPHLSVNFVEYTAMGDSKIYTLTRKSNHAEDDKVIEFDITNPLNPVMGDEIGVPDCSWRKIVSYNGYLIVSCGDEFRIVDPDTLQIVQVYDFPGSLFGAIGVQGDYLYAAEYGEIGVFDISSLPQIVEVDSIQIPSPNGVPKDIEFFGDAIYLWKELAGVSVFEIMASGSINHVKELSSVISGEMAVSSKGFLLGGYNSGQGYGFYLFDLRNNELNPVLVKQQPVDSHRMHTGASFSPNGERLYLSWGGQSIFSEKIVKMDAIDINSIYQMEKIEDLGLGGIKGPMTINGELFLSSPYKVLFVVDIP